MTLTGHTRTSFLLTPALIIIILSFLNFVKRFGPAFDGREKHYLNKLYYYYIGGIGEAASSSTKSVQSLYFPL